MHARIKPLQQSLLFYAIALSLAIVLALAAPWIGEGVLLLTMFTPLVSVILCRSLSPEGHRFRFSELGLSRLGLAQWPFALIVPLVVILPGFIVVWATGVGHVLPVPADATPVKLALNILGALVFGTVLGALGEEVGWRGYLLPRLVEAFGIGRAGLLSGFLHGAWHLPVILFTSYYIADGSRLVTVPLFLVLVTLSGPIFAHLRLASASILPVALMHNAWNVSWETLSSVTAGDNTALIAYLSGETGLVTIAAMVAANLWLLWRSRTRGSAPVTQPAT